MYSTLKEGVNLPNSDSDSDPVANPYLMEGEQGAKKAGNKTRDDGDDQNVWGGFGQSRIKAMRLRARSRDAARIPGRDPDLLICEWILTCPSVNGS